jgi:hypothetical protein
MGHNLLRQRMILACCGAITAAFILKHTAALAQATGSCGFANSAAGCLIDSNGCEIAQGIGLINSCNSGARPDGTTFLLSHKVNPPAGQALSGSSEFDAFGPSGSSSFMTLYCTDNNNPASALFRGALNAGMMKACPSTQFPIAFAFRSICGPFSVCAQLPNGTFVY